MAALPVLPWFLLLYALLGRKKKPWLPTPSTVHHAVPHGPTHGAAAFPAPPPAVVPVMMPSGPTSSAAWVPYHPLTTPVVARAEQILRDPGAPHEIIEADPGGQGKVRYLKLNAPPGHWSVTAWRPSLNAPSPMAQQAAAAAHSQASQPAYVPPLRPGRTLRRGMSGPDVAAWNDYLGVPGTAFGALTETMTKAFQRKQRPPLDQDGKVGPRTRAAAGYPPGV